MNREAKLTAIAVAGVSLAGCLLMSSADAADKGTVAKKVAAATALAASGLEDFNVRDPFVLVDGGKYYLYHSKPWSGGPGVSVRESTDLKLWTDSKVVMSLPPEIGCIAYWAPEVHKFGGFYWLFVTITQAKTAVGADGKKRYDERRGTWVFKSAAPQGPFLPVKNEPLPPRTQMTLDGTLYVEDGTPYMVYCHEWVQIGNGTVDYAPLKSGFTGFAAEPRTLFSARDAIPGAGCVTDGPFFYRSEKSGRLYLIWSNLYKGGTYCLLMRRSDSGKLSGPWTKDRPLFLKDGGHGMIFKGLDGVVYLTLHQPNTTSNERMRLFRLEDDGEWLNVK